MIINTLANLTFFLLVLLVPVFAVQSLASFAMWELHYSYNLSSFSVYERIILGIWFLISSVITFARWNVGK